MRPGARVRVYRLKWRPQLNGQGGVIVGREGERWQVALDDAKQLEDATQIVLKPANLLLVEDTPAARWKAKEVLRSAFLGEAPVIVRPDLDELHCSSCKGTGQCPDCSGEGWFTTGYYVENIVVGCMNCGGSGCDDHFATFVKGSGRCYVCGGSGEDATKVHSWNLLQRRAAADELERVRSRGKGGKMGGERDGPSVRDLQQLAAADELERLRRRGRGGGAVGDGPTLAPLLPFRETGRARKASPYPGIYRITYHGTVVKRDIARESMPIAELDEGSIVKIVAVVVREDMRRIRAKLQDDDWRNSQNIEGYGWITLEDLDDGSTWAVKEGSLAAKPPPDPDVNFQQPYDEDDSRFRHVPATTVWQPEREAYGEEKKVWEEADVDVQRRQAEQKIKEESLRARGAFAWRLQ